VYRRELEGGLRSTKRSDISHIVLGRLVENNLRRILGLSAYRCGLGSRAVKDLGKVRFSIYTRLLKFKLIQGNMTPRSDDSVV